jgi:hypothetical protein
LQVARYVRIANLIPGAACREVMSLEVAIDGHGWTNGETAAALQLDIAVHRRIRQ